MAETQDMVVVCELGNPADIALAESLLRAADIPYFLHGLQGQVYGMFVPAMNVRVMVKPTQLDQAREALANLL